MPNPHDTVGALEALQKDMYREKILRARQSTLEQRFADVLALTNAVFDRMHAGAMWQLNLCDPDEGWAVVRQRLDRLQKVHDEGRFVSARPPVAE